jgi:hypothetical protein
MSEPSTLDAFITKHLAGVLREAGFVRKGRVFTKDALPLRAAAHVLKYQSHKHFNVRFAILIPAYSNSAAIAHADLSRLACGESYLPEWRWPMIRSEKEVAGSLTRALSEVGLPWCERLLSLGELHDTLEAERPSPVRALHLSHVCEQMGNAAEAFFWWREYCDPSRGETARGTPAWRRLKSLAGKAGLPLEDEEA